MINFIRICLKELKISFNHNKLRTISEIESQIIKRFRLRIATVVMLSVVSFAVAIAAAWFAGVSTITNIFTYLHLLQDNPPWWVEVPTGSWEYSLAPTAILFLSALVVMKVSPQQRAWSRALVVGILLALMIRYTMWRSLSTLNLTNPLSGVFSLSLFFMELVGLLAISIQLFLTVGVKDRRREADRRAVAVLDGNFTPTVDILIPTYNEPTFILRRTIIGCQALSYPHKKVYLLDDLRRSEMRHLAEELGCEYITRADNIYAKAGNLNNAIAQTTGELIVVFDADFVPTKNFLTRTVGFFQDKTMALVQTHQDFYNFDPTTRNLGLENITTHEPEEFSRHIQPIRDGADSTLCYGSSFVVKRSYLEELGGFVTESLSEDYFTGICLSARGYQVIFLDENLSAGLAAENIAEHIAQRQRWARGTIQAFFINANPLTIPGLRLRQRLAHLEGLLLWFTNISRIGFLLLPLAYPFLGVLPIKSTVLEGLYFFLPYYILQLSTFSWLNHRSRSAFISDVYFVSQCFPIAITVIQTMLSPFSKGFTVTPKGNKRDRFYFNWILALPLVILLVATIVSLGRNLEIYLMIKTGQIVITPESQQQFEGLGLNWIWSAYNLLALGLALLAMLDVPKSDLYEGFDLRRVVKLNIADQTFWGVTTMISEVRAEIAFTKTPLLTSLNQSVKKVKIEIMEEQLKLEGQITNIDFTCNPTMQVEFKQVNLAQHRRLVEMLFCRPGRWERRDVPGELRSLLLLLRILLKPKFLFDRNKKVKAIAVSQV